MILKEETDLSLMLFLVLVQSRHLMNGLKSIMLQGKQLT